MEERARGHDKAIQARRHPVRQVRGEVVRQCYECGRVQFWPRGDWIDERTGVYAIWSAPGLIRKEPGVSHGLCLMDFNRLMSEIGGPRDRR